MWEISDLNTSHHRSHGRFKLSNKKGDCDLGIEVLPKSASYIWWKNQKCLNHIGLYRIISTEISFCWGSTLNFSLSNFKWVLFMKYIVKVCCVHHHRLPIDFDEGCFKLDLWGVFSSILPSTSLFSFFQWCYQHQWSFS